MSPVFRLSAPGAENSLYGGAIPLGTGTYPVIGTHPTTKGTSRIFHRAPCDLTGIRLLFHNGAPNDVTIAAAVDIATYSGIAPVTFGGRLQPVVSANGFVLADPCDLIVPGIGFFTRTYMDPGGHVWYPNYRVAQTGEGHNYGVSGTDLTPYGSASVPSVSGEFAFAPVGFAGVPVGQRPKFVGVFGDSIDCESNGVGGGAVVRALNASGSQTGRTLAAVVQCGIGGTGIEQPGQIGGQWQMALAGGADVVMSGAAINNVRGSSYTAAQMKAAWLAAWRQWALRGAQVWHRTILPTADFSGSGALTGPQEAVRVACNTWLRAGAPIDPLTLAAVAVGTNGALLAGQVGHWLTGYWDPCTVIETSQNSGIPVDGMLEDGTHPTDAGYTAMAALVPLTAMGIE